MTLDDLKLLRSLLDSTISTQESAARLIAMSEDEKRKFAEKYGANSALIGNFLIRLVDRADRSGVLEVPDWGCSIPFEETVYKARP